MKHWPFKVVSDDTGAPKIEVYYRGDKKTFSAEEM